MNKSKLIKIKKNQNSKVLKTIINNKTNKFRGNLSEDKIMLVRKQKRWINY